MLDLLRKSCDQERYQNKAICAQLGEHIVFAITGINLFSAIFHNHTS